MNNSKTGYWCQNCGNFTTIKPKICNYDIKIFDYEKLKIFFKEFILKNNSKINLYEYCHEKDFLEKDIHHLIKCESEIFFYQTRSIKNISELNFNELYRQIEIFFKNN